MLKKVIAKIKQIQGRMLRDVMRRDSKGEDLAVWKRGLLNSDTQGNEREGMPFTSSVSYLIFLDEHPSPKASWVFGLA